MARDVVKTLEAASVRQSGQAGQSGHKVSMGSAVAHSHMELLTQDELTQLKNRHRPYLLFKRMYDALNAFIQIILFSPILLLSSLAIWLYDRGPVFFYQQRMTGGPEGARTFNIIKFRTMVVDAEKRGGKITEKRDPRITPVGRVLRSLKFDEMPQLFNILKGDMSFVGPRPQTMGYVEAFKDHYHTIHSIIPAGLTDLASLKYREEGQVLSEVEDPEAYYIKQIMPDKIKCHYEYFKRMSFGLDLWILAMTLLMVFVVKPVNKILKRK